MNPIQALLRLFTRIRTGHGLKLIITLLLIMILGGTLYTLNFEYSSSVITNITNHGTKAVQGAHEFIKIDSTYYKKIFNLLSPEKKYQHDVEIVDKYTPPTTTNADEGSSSLDRLKSLIRDDLIQLLKASKPTIKTINDKKHYKGRNKFKAAWNKKIPVLDGKLREDNIRDPVRTKEYLSSFLKLKDDEIDALRLSHFAFASNIDNLITDELKFQGDGVLYVGGGKYNWLVLLSLKQLRNVGSVLPAEVFIPLADEQISKGFCEDLFPKFGAKCVYMSEFIPGNDLDFIKNISNGYQYKSIALLVSSFARVLMLDSDNFALVNPDLFFVNEPFTSQHFLVWPDFWRRSVSPNYYKLAEIPVAETEKVRDSYKDQRGNPEGVTTEQDYYEKISYHDLKGTIPESSSEAGEMLINKQIHLKTILLAVYYNFNGPKFYYPLLAQGQAGEGDKDTFIAAAHYWRLPYYQIQEYVREFGDIKDQQQFKNGNIDFEINAMGQYDPIIDYLQTLDAVAFKDDQHEYDSSKNNYFLHRFKHSQLGFLHTNLPKLYPWDLNRQNSVRTIFDKEGHRKRLYTLLVDELGYDMELKIWEIMKWFLCDYDNVYQELYGDENKFKDLMGQLFKGMKLDESCNIVEEQVEFLKAT